MNRFQRWYEKNKKRCRQRNLIYYHANKHIINPRRRKIKRKTKEQKEFRLKRNKCIYYLIRVRGKSYREVAARLSICDPKNVWKMLKTYERNKNEKEIF